MKRWQRRWVTAVYVLIMLIAAIEFTIGLWAAFTHGV